MRKLFFTFCFIGFFICSTNLHSAVRSVTGGPAGLEMESNKDKRPKTKPELPIFRSEAEYNEYLKERIKKAVITEIHEEELNSNGSTSVLPSDDYIESMKENDKSFFQKVYDNAMARVTNQPSDKHKDIVAKDIAIESAAKQQAQWKQPDYPTVNATLPGGTKALVPAVEHIPYFMSEIDILPTGIIKINETIVVVANAEKLKNGLSKSLSKYSFSRDGKKNHLAVNISYVKVNGKEIDYKIEEIGNLLIFSPETEYTLEPGVYTYEIEYIVDRQIIDYKDFREFYWNITGNNWNLIVARVGAMLKMPGKVADLGRSGFINTPNGIDMMSVNAIKNDIGNAIGFVSNRPVFVGESMDMIISMPNENFIPIDLDKKINEAIDDYGDIILTSLGLIAIAGAYFVSWIFISDNRSNSKYSMARNAPILRYLTRGVFDKISFGSFLLELYKKNIIDLKEGTIIKLTDKLNNLTKNERIAVNSLFPNKESAIKVDRTNFLKINRAYIAAETDTKERIRKFLLKINSGYIIFSIAMLLLSQLGIALLGYSPVYNISIMVCSDIMLALSMGIITKKIHSNWFKYLAKTTAILIIIASFMILLSILNVVSSLILILTIYVIFAYTNMFSNRNGLIKNNIKEAKATRENLIKNIETISASPRNFSSQQPNIFAFELIKQFGDNLKDKEYYKLTTVEDIISKI